MIATMTPPRMRRHRRLARLAFIAALVGGGCATLEELAPPVGEEARRAADASGVAIDRVERGREIYVTACVRCHSPEPVLRYTAEEWAEILPRMIVESDLGATDAADIAHYVRITLRAGAARVEATHRR